MPQQPPTDSTRNRRSAPRIRILFVYLVPAWNTPFLPSFTANVSDHARDPWHTPHRDRARSRRSFLRPPSTECFRHDQLAPRRSSRSATRRRRIAYSLARKRVLTINLFVVVAHFWIGSTYGRNSNMLKPFLARAITTPYLRSRHATRQRIRLAEPRCPSFFLLDIRYGHLLSPTPHSDSSCKH